MSKQIKACPFCGEQPVEENIADGLFITMCHECSKGHSLESWNHRPIEDELQARIDGLTAINHCLTQQLEKNSFTMSNATREIERLQDQLSRAESVISRYAIGKGVLSDLRGAIFIREEKNAELAREYFKSKGEV